MVSITNCLFGNNVDRAGAFLALTKLELDRLAFVQIRVAAGLDFGVVHKQIRPSVIRNYKPKTFASIEPFYFTCTHNNTPWPAIRPSICNMPLIFVLEDIPERRKDMLYKTHIIH